MALLEKIGTLLAEKLRTAAAPAVDVYRGSCDFSRRIRRRYERCASCTVRPVGTTRAGAAVYGQAQWDELARVLLALAERAANSQRTQGDPVSAIGAGGRRSWRKPGQRRKKRLSGCWLFEPQHLAAATACFHLSGDGEAGLGCWRCTKCCWDTRRRRGKIQYMHKIAELAEQAVGEAAGVFVAVPKAYALRESESSIVGLGSSLNRTATAGGRSGHLERAGFDLCASGAGKAGRRCAQAGLSAAARSVDAAEAASSRRGAQLWEQVLAKDSARRNWR